eukprot:365278-Chlamydomonas_euryale.AAC.7
MPAPIPANVLTAWRFAGGRKSVLCGAGPASAGPPIERVPAASLCGGVLPGKCMCSSVRVRISFLYCKSPPSSPATRAWSMMRCCCVQHAGK